LLFLLGLMSLPLAQGKSIAIPEFLRQTIIWLIPYCAVLTYCRRQRDFVRLARATTIGALVVAIIAIGEASSRRLLADVLSPLIADNAEWLQNVQTAKVRDGIFRAQATHSHPLSLGEHLAFAAPFAVAFFLRARRFGGRFFWGAAFMAIALGAVASNSRGAMLVIAISFGAMSALLAYRFLKRAAASRWRPLAGLIVLACVVVSPAAAIGAHAIVSGKAGQSAANSTQSRVDQIEMAWPKIKARPVLGYGSGRSARVVGYWGRTLTLDNYYLTLALDLGLPGPLAFIEMLAAFGRASLKRSRSAHPSLGVVYVACFAAAVSIAISRSIASQTGNLTLIYMMLAAFAGASATFSRRRSRNRA
ncbi:MAG: O-antigen ligase family protein, partial [Parvularculaceae bacterium]|nr:O-antigen ligase family protein [Parvularculaceae bacterium]